MRSTRPLMRWLALLAALVLFAAACGDDGDDTSAADDGAAADDGGDDMADDAGDDGSADGADDAGDDGGDDMAGDDMADDAGDDMADGADDAGDDGSADGAALLGDCDEFASALDGLDDLSTNVDPTDSTDPEQIQADFARAQASIAALRDALPDDLKDDADAIADGLAVMEQAFASIGYDVTTLASPDDALEFAGVLSGPEVLAMAGASVNIQTWIAAGCGG